MTMEVDWEGVSDCTEPPKKRNSLTVAFFNDIRSAKLVSILTLPTFARAALTRLVSTMSLSEENTIQLYCSKDGFSFNESNQPYYVKTLTDDFSFTITITPETDISVSRRYVSKEAL